jgi:hypothetical protein
MFNERQKAMLKAVARPTKDPTLGKINEKLDSVIAQLSLESSRAFLTDADLKKRVFYHKPAHLRQDEYAGYMYEFIGR